MEREKVAVAVLRIPDENRTLRDAEAIADYLAGCGIDYERWTPGDEATAAASSASSASAAAALEAYAEKIDELKARGGYVELLALGEALFLLAPWMAGASAGFSWRLGLGGLISSVSQNAGQAIQMAMFVMLPSIMFSGMIFPLAAMPSGLALSGRAKRR